MAGNGIQSEAKKRRREREAQNRKEKSMAREYLHVVRANKTAEKDITQH